MDDLYAFVVYMFAVGVLLVLTGVAWCVWGGGDGR